MIYLLCACTLFSIAFNVRLAVGRATHFFALIFWAVHYIYYNTYINKDIIEGSKFNFCFTSSQATIRYTIRCSWANITQRRWRTLWPLRLQSGCGPCQNTKKISRKRTERNLHSSFCCLIKKCKIIWRLIF